MTDELTTRDKLAATLAAFGLTDHPVSIANALTPYVDELLAQAREDGYREAMGYSGEGDRPSRPPLPSPNRLLEVTLDDSPPVPLNGEGDR